MLVSSVINADGSKFGPGTIFDVENDGSRWNFYKAGTLVTLLASAVGILFTSLQGWDFLSMTNPFWNVKPIVLVGFAFWRADYSLWAKYGSTDFANSTFMNEVKNTALFVPYENLVHEEHV